MTIGLSLIQCEHSHVIVDQDGVDGIDANCFKCYCHKNTGIMQIRMQCADRFWLIIGKYKGVVLSYSFDGLMDFKFSSENCQLYETGLYAYISSVCQIVSAKCLIN